MKESIFNRISKISEPNCFVFSPSDLKYLSKIEKRLNIIFPTDYKEFMAKTDGFSLYAFKTKIIIYSIEDLDLINEDELYQMCLPEMIIIGDDGGNTLYFYDPKNKLSEGEFALFQVKMDELYLDSTLFVGKSLSHLIDLIMDNQVFSEF